MNTIAVRTKWSSKTPSARSLVKLCPRAKDATNVHVNRPYDARHTDELQGLLPLEATTEQIQDWIGQAKPALKAGAAALGEHAATMAAAVTTWIDAVTPTSDTAGWSGRATAAVTASAAHFRLREAPSPTQRSHQLPRLSA